MHLQLQSQIHLSMYGKKRDRFQEVSSTFERVASNLFLQGVPMPDSVARSWEKNVLNDQNALL